MSDIKKIKIEDIDEFKNHPFNVNQDESLNELVISIKENGLLNPIIVRPKGERYEVVSGHRRLKAFEIIGNDEIDAYVKNLTDEEAIIFMVDSNLQRDYILPSEKAFAYKMKLEAMKHQGKKLVTSAPMGQKLYSRKELAGYSKDSSTSIQRYIRLTYLIPELLKIVDNTVIGTDKHSITMGIRPAVELSYLNKDEQQLVYSEMTYDDLSPTHAQAIKIRKLSETKRLNAEILEDILMQEKGNQHDQISFNKEKIVSVLPHELINRDKRYVEEYIVRALQSYSKKLERGDENDLEL